MDSSATRIFLELRDSDHHNVRFAAVDLTTGTLLWQKPNEVELDLEDSWWVTLHSASSRYLLLQSFTDTHNPEKKSYYVIEIATQQIVWQSDQFQIVEIADKYLLGYAADDKTRTLIQITLPEGNIQENSTMQKSDEIKNKSTSQPFFYSENQPYFATVANFIESLGLSRPVGGCEYLEYDGGIGITYYVADKTAERNGLANYLLILDKRGVILLNECLERSVPQVGLDTFFIAQNQLIVVQHQLQLVSYALS